MAYIDMAHHMKPIHSFPARMAPDIALQHLREIPAGAVVCDPMCGSGTVPLVSQSLGHQVVAYDMDPLAHLITSVSCSSPAIAFRASALAERFLAHIEACNEVRLPWIDDDLETTHFVQYWFGRGQIKQLRRAAYFLAHSEHCEKDQRAADLLRVALSRLIVKKTNGASLAWDVSHSRPHRVYDAQTYEFDVYQELVESIKFVCDTLLRQGDRVKCTAKLGDARKLPGLRGKSIDAIVTSPPYLNAIDYLRGHRLSLVWLGWSIPDLRRIRSDSVGSEVSDDLETWTEAERTVLGAYALPESTDRQAKMVHRYVRDLVNITRSARRVLKPGGTATYVVGDNVLRGTILRNSTALVRALESNGFYIKCVETREIPARHRYLPVKVDASNALANRMREEFVITAVSP